MINAMRKFFGYKFPRTGKFINQILFKIIPPEIFCELFPKIKVTLNLKDLTHRATFWQGERFEFPTTRILKLWGGSSFFDIGANYGFYSFFMLTTFPDIQVYAFEPNLSTYNHILQIKEDNDSKSLQIFNIGLGSKETEANLYLGGDDSGHSTFLDHPDFLSILAEKVKISTFDQWRVDQNLDLPKQPEWVAKIDVEGMEFDVLIGMKNALEMKAFKGIIIEVLDFTLALANRKSKDIFNFMNSVGYKPINEADLLSRYGRINTANVFFEQI